MKTLLVMRHANAAWANAHTADHDRPLTGAGLAQVAEIAAALNSGSAAPGRILSSTALRALQTAEALAGALASPPEVVARRGLYLAEPDACLEQIRSLTDAIDTVLLVGHNPGLEALVRRLTGETVGFGPATLARLELDCVSWQGVEDSCGDTTGVWRPGA